MTTLAELKSRIEELEASNGNLEARLDTAQEAVRIQSDKIADLQVIAEYCKTFYDSIKDLAKAANKAQAF